MKSTPSKPVVTCDVCGVMFQTTKQRLETHVHKFCSRGCANSFYKTKPNTYTEKKCHRCGSTSIAQASRLKPGTLLFCSGSCRTAHFNEERARPIRELFMNNVDKTSSCWLWTGALGRGGYGRATAARGKKNRSELAHRLSHKLFKGPIPKGMFVCHTCDNPRCVNPDHLWLGTRQDNVDDMVSKGRSLRGTRNPHARLNPQQVREIRRRVAEGENRKDIQEEYGIAPSTLHSIIKRVSWDWLD